MRRIDLLFFGLLLLGACQRSTPPKDPNVIPFELPEKSKEPTTPLNSAASFGPMIAHALEVRDSITLIAYLDTSVTWEEMSAVLGTIRAAKGRTDSVRVASTQTNFKMVNGKSSLGWKIGLHGYHEKGTTEQSVVVDHRQGRPWIVGYHVDK